MLYLMGARGFVGSAFNRYFQSLAVDFMPIEVDNYHQYIGTNCAILLNANGSSKKYLAEQDPKLDFRLNVASVMDSLNDFNCGLYVLLSTVDVYPDVSNPVNNGEEALIKPEGLSPYGFHKYLAELCVKEYSRNWLIIRLGGMVGMGLKKNPVYDLLHSQPLRVHPESKYQYMNTMDVAKLIYQLICDGHQNEVVNLCGDGVIAISEIEEMLGIPCEDNHLKQEHYEVNIQKIKGLYPVPSTMLTIKMFLDDYRQKPRA